MTGLPSPRGPLSGSLLRELVREPHPLPDVELASDGDPLADEDLQLARLGFGEEATRFFDEHVTADAVHENIAAVDLAGGLAKQDPSLCSSILWGGRALDWLDVRWAEHVLGCWVQGRSSLRADDARPSGHTEELVDAAGHPTAAV